VSRSIDRRRARARDALLPLAALAASAALAAAASGESAARRPPAIEVRIVELRVAEPARVAALDALRAERHDAARARAARADRALFAALLASAAPAAAEAAPASEAASEARSAARPRGARARERAAQRAQDEAARLAAALEGVAPRARYACVLRAGEAATLEAWSPDLERAFVRGVHVAAVADDHARLVLAEDFGLGLGPRRDGPAEALVPLAYGRAHVRAVTPVCTARGRAYDVELVTVQPAPAPARATCTAWHAPGLGPDAPRRRVADAGDVPRWLPAAPAPPPAPERPATWGR